MAHNLNIGDRVQFFGYCGKERRGTVKAIAKNKVKVLKDGHTGEGTYSLRKDGRFVLVGWSMDEASHMGYFYNKKIKVTNITLK